MPDKDYLDPEAKARIDIDAQLHACGWDVQNYRAANLRAARGVAVREFVMRDGHASSDYLLFVDGKAAGIIEAKPVGMTLTGVEWQSNKYRDSLPDSISALMTPLPFEYESTGKETRFTNGYDHPAASRHVFTFHQPDLFAEIARTGNTLRNGLQQLPALIERDLWPAQATAIRNLETSLAHGRRRALIQMATGSGKTFTACNIAYRLIKHAGACRVLFLVDRSHLGRQTLGEFQSFRTPDDGRTFTELYNVQHLTRNRIDQASRVVISTIQRLYSILKGEPDLAEEFDERSSYEIAPREPVHVEYRPDVPIETFDVIIVDECHRSIYGVWQEVLTYFDALIIGLTATPGTQTLGFFQQNIVMEYSHPKAVADGVNVDFDVYRISTEITAKGGKIEAQLVTTFRDRVTREKRLQKLDEEIIYNESELDRRVVAKDQIRKIIRAFRDALPQMFPNRTMVPKTLIFAKDDSHAEDIVDIVREEFGQGNDFAAKITYKSGSTGQTPQDLLSAFRTAPMPRIAVTVDMIATGTDVKPIECVVFMRMVRSRTFFEQMKGRGVRVIDDDELQKVSGEGARKDRFVLVDAVGVTEADLHDTIPMDRERNVGLERLLLSLSFGNRDAKVVSSVTSRLANLDKRLTPADKTEIETLAGQPLHEIVSRMADALGALDDDAPDAPQRVDAAVNLIATNPELRDRLVNLRRNYEQAIDDFSIDRVIRAEFSKDATDRARRAVESFREFIEQHKNEITALQILYSRPRHARLTYAQIKELSDAIHRTPERWTPKNLWNSYEALDKSKVRGSGGKVLADIVSIVRFALRQDGELVPYREQVESRFEDWLAKQHQTGRKFTQEQLSWLRLVVEQIGTSVEIAEGDFDDPPFSDHGGLGKAYQIFGNQLQPLLDELNEALAA